MAVSFNGKARFTISVSPEATQDEIRELALAAPDASRWLDGKTIRKVIVVPGKIVNIVVG